MMKRIVSVIWYLSLIFLWIGCGKKEEQKDVSIKDLRDKKGVPVEVKSVKSSELIVWNKYNTTLKGIEQVNTLPKLSDRLKRINVEEGDYVKKDQIVAHYYQDVPQAKYRIAQSKYQTMKKTYQRMKKVFESGGISRQKLDEVKSKYISAKENFRYTSDFVNIKAPISGIVTDVPVEEDNMLDPRNDVICKIAKIDKMKAKILIEESSIPKYEKGQKVKVKWDAYPEKSFYGEITKISLSSTDKLRSFTLEATIENENKILKPGIYVDTYIRTQKIDSTIKVSRYATVKENDQRFVYVAENGKAVKKPVELGTETGRYFQVTSGVSPGDSLIVEGVNMLSDSIKINVVN